MRIDRCHMGIGPELCRTIALEPVRIDFISFHRVGMVQMAEAAAQPIPIGIGKVRDAPDGPFQRDRRRPDPGRPRRRDPRP